MGPPPPALLEDGGAIERQPPFGEPRPSSKRFEETGGDLHRKVCNA